MPRSYIFTDMCDHKRWYLQRGEIGLSVGVTAQKPMIILYSIIGILITDDKITPFLKRTVNNPIKNGVFNI